MLIVKFRYLAKTALKMSLKFSFIPSDIRDFTVSISLRDNH